MRRAGFGREKKHPALPLEKNPPGDCPIAALCSFDFGQHRVYWPIILPSHLAPSAEHSAYCGASGAKTPNGHHYASEAQAGAADNSHQDPYEGQDD